MAGSAMLKHCAVVKELLNEKTIFISVTRYTYWFLRFLR
jgi:hypothetical protein